LGPSPRFCISDWLVCRIARNPNLDHSCHSNEQNSLPAKPRQPRSHAYLGIGNCARNLSPVFPHRFVAGFYAVTTAILATLIADSAGLYAAHAGYKKLVATEEVDLTSVTGAVTIETLSILHWRESSPGRPPDNTWLRFCHQAIQPNWDTRNRCYRYRQPD